MSSRASVHASNAPRCDGFRQLSYRAVGVVRPSVRQAGKRFANHDGIAPLGQRYVAKLHLAVVSHARAEHVAALSSGARESASRSPSEALNLLFELWGFESSTELLAVFLT